jgi:hypothetical protein
MHRLEFDKEVISEKPSKISESAIVFDKYQGDFEGSKSKMAGISQNEPYDKNTNTRDFDKIRIIPVSVGTDSLQNHFENFLNKLEEGIDDWPHYNFTGLEDIFNCEIEVLNKERWYIADKPDRDSYEEIGEKIISEYESFQEGRTRNIVLFMTQSSSMSPKPTDESEYFGMKEKLVGGFLPSQSISFGEGGVLRSEMKGNLNSFTMFNVACQLYTKIGGVPWAVKKGKNAVEADIDIGIRASKAVDKEDNYVYGVAQVFSQYGKWKEALVETGDASLTSSSYDMPYDTMKKLLEASYRKYSENIQGDSSASNIERINVQKMKGFWPQEKKAAIDFAEKKDVDICLIDITKSSTRIYRGQPDQADHILRGFMKKLNSNSSILCTTGDHKKNKNGEWTGHKVGTPRPILVSVEQGEDLRTPDIEEVTKHIFRMTRINYDDAVNTGFSLPITLNYAGKMGNFIRRDIEPNEDPGIPWFI